MNNKKVITRFAPSPTGHLHLGGARTALLSYFFATKNKGIFIIRTEDTDRKRHNEAMVLKHIELLEWLGIKTKYSTLYDKNYSQSHRMKIYEAKSNWLLKQKVAFKCFCDDNKIKLLKEKYYKKNTMRNYIYNGGCGLLSLTEINGLLENKTPFVIRIKAIANETFEFVDLIRGKISFDGNDIDDFIIIKTDKSPTYNFAAVVDDIDMNITHVLRGEEHISNTPKQLLLYRYFDRIPPLYAHLSIIVNENRKKLSKRDSEINQFIDNYKNMGFLPVAVTNFLSLLGYKPNGRQEFFSLEELINFFSFKKLSKSPGIFDYKKLLWFNQKYIKKLNDEEYLLIAQKYVATTTYFNGGDQKLLLLFYKEKILYFSQLQQEIYDFCNYFLILKITPEMLIKLHEFKYKKIEISLLKALDKIKINQIIDAKKIIEYVIKDTDIKSRNLYMPLRIIITGKEHGIELDKTIYLLRNKNIKDIIMKRLYESKE